MLHLCLRLQARSGCVCSAAWLSTAQTEPRLLRFPACNSSHVAACVFRWVTTPQVDMLTSGKAGAYADADCVMPGEACSSSSSSS